MMFSSWRSGFSSIGVYSGAKLDREPARSRNIERIGMQPLRRRHIVSIFPQAAVDLVHSLFALDKEADMKVAWIYNVSGLTCLHQRQHEPVVVRQEGHTGVPAHTSQPEIPFQKRAGCPNVGDS